MSTNLLEHDQQQRQQAIDPSESFIVQAPAGSGKTELLIQRFLVLLQYATTPDEILAITFTKKAANEMRVRIMKALKNSVESPEPESAHAKLTWKLAKQVLKRDHELQWHLLNNPNQLRIQTIDSLCSYLTRQLPILAHLGSPPDISDTPKLLYQEAVAEILTQVEADDEFALDISTLLLHLDNNLNKLHDLLITLLSKRDQWLPYLHLDADSDAIKATLEYQMGEVITEHLQTLTELFPTDLIFELTSLSRFAAAQLSLNKVDSPIVSCLNLESIPDVTPENRLTWLGIAKILMTENDWRKAFDTRIGFPSPSSTKNSEEKMIFQEYKQRISALVEQLHQHEELKTMLIELRYLPEPFYQTGQWTALKALLRVLKYTAAQLRVSFQQHGQMDFIENTQAAMLALGNDELPTDLALALDYQIKHILIDEFQDTSINQYRLLEKLTMGWEQGDGRTLFIVGDPMQSIYRFREAEVGLFIRLREQGIHQLHLTPLVLSMNFRSTPGIVSWNNHHFATIFPSFNDIATGAIHFTASIAKTSLITEETSAAVTLSGFIDAEPQAQAAHITQMIAKQLNAHPEQNIAVLVRARHHLKAIIPALKKANISYRALEIDPLNQRQLIQDLISLTRALLHPNDRIAWLAVLRAPWCGLTLADLHILAGSSPHKTIYEQLQNNPILNTLSADGLLRIKRVSTLMNAAIASRQRYSLRHWIEQLWYDLGGPACLHDSLLMEDVEVFFKLLEELDQQAEPFNFEKLKIKIDKLFATATHHDAKVQLMTIHSAKGLEFDCVILPNLESKSASNENPLLLWMDRPLAHGQQALLLAPIHATGNEKDPIYTYITRQQQIKIDYELSRLLYVATTRAKQQLHLVFNLSKNDKDEFQVISGSLLKKLWPALKDNIQEYIIPSTPTPVESTDKKRFIQRLHHDWRHPLANQVQNEKAAIHQRYQGFQLPDLKPKIIGTVMHQLLQLLANKGVNWWQQQSSTQQCHYLKYRLSMEGISHENLSACVTLLQTKIDKVLNDPTALWILHPYPTAQAEFALTAVIKGEVKNLVIDRTFIDDKGIRWIIDYKTATPDSGVKIDAFLRAKKDKYQEQLQQYAQALQLIESQPVKLGLYFVGIPHLYVFD